MAGTLVIDTLKSGTSNPPAFQNTSGTEVGQLCRARVNFAGATGTIAASFNVSSVTRDATGYYTVNFANALVDANYSCIATNRYRGSGSFETCVISGAPTASNVQIGVADIVSGSTVDPTSVSVAIFR